LPRGISFLTKKEKEKKDQRLLNTRFPQNFQNSFLPPIFSLLPHPTDSYLPPPIEAPPTQIVFPPPTRSADHLIPSLRYLSLSLSTVGHWIFVVFFSLSTAGD